MQPAVDAAEDRRRRVAGTGKRAPGEAPSVVAVVLAERIDEMRRALMVEADQTEREAAGDMAFDLVDAAREQQPGPGLLAHPVRHPGNPAVAAHDIAAGG